MEFSVKFQKMKNTKQQNDKDVDKWEANSEKHQLKHKNYLQYFNILPAHAAINTLPISVHVYCSSSKARI